MQTSDNAEQDVRNLIHSSAIEDESIYIQRSGFPKYLMISAGVSKFGKTSLHFVEKGVKSTRNITQATSSIR